METSIQVLEIGAVLTAAALAGWIARRLTLPAVIGYLVVGLAVSPFTPGYVADREQIALLAEIGVVLLLFEVGIELDVGRLRREQPGLILAVPVQLAISTAIAGAAFHLASLPLGVGLVLGLAVALSSSVVVVNITRSARRRTDRATETALLGWSLVQDVAGVLFAAILLAIVGFGERGAETAIVGLVAFSILATIAARILPRLLHVLRPHPDLFLIVSITSGLVGAGVGATFFGIPLALAAFIAGLVITDSPEASEVRRRLLPFRDVFAVLFFVAIGSLLDPRALADGLGWLALLVALLVGAKVLPIWILARAAGVGRPSQVAVGLAQIGEFSYVLAALLYAEDMIPPELYAALLAIVALSIGISAVAARLPVPGWTREARSAAG